MSRHKLHTPQHKPDNIYENMNLVLAAPGYSSLHGDWDSDSIPDTYSKTRTAGMLPAVQVHLPEGKTRGVRTSLPNHNQETNCSGGDGNCKDCVGGECQDCVGGECQGSMVYCNAYDRVGESAESKARTNDWTYCNSQSLEEESVCVLQD